MARVIVICALIGCATAGDDFEAQPGRRVDASVNDSTNLDTSFAADTAVVDSAIAETTADTTPMVDSATMMEVAMETGPMTTTLAIDTTECKAIACPASHPYVVGCKVTVGGDSSQLCIVYTAGSTSVTFKEGQSCGGETVKGSITCSTEPGTALTTTNCTSNKTKPLYITTIGACPT
jgi:hypothetical protein